MKKRLPAFASILPVFAVIAFLVYGWTMIVFLWKLPSWILYLTLGEILAVFAYSMTFALLESFLILTLLLLACMALPPAWMRDAFVTRATFAVLVSLGSIMLYMARYAVVGYDFIRFLIPWSLAALALTGLAAFFSTRLRWMVRAAA